MGRVIDALTRISSYTPKVSASKLTNERVVTGRGISLLPTSKN
jgi:hypothetical protein